MKINILIAIIILLGLKSGVAQSATPTFTPGGGTYSGSVTVTVSTTTSGASLFCTTDGSVPDISSSMYSSPHIFVVNTNQVLSCVAAVVGINQTNAQNQNPISSYWKSPPNCRCGGSFPSCSTTTYNHPGVGCQADDPGGSGVPLSATWSNGISTPSLSGSSMKFGETSQPSEQTNILFALHSSFGICDGCTQFLETHDYFWPSSSISSSDEDDMYQFNKTSNIRYMAGAQYCHGSGCPGGVAGWDFWGNSNVPWTYTGVTAGGTRDVWHHYQRYMFRIPSEETSRPCSSSGAWPYIYIKYLGIDGTNYTSGGSPWKACANALPSTWSGGGGMQAQIDIASHASSTVGTQYWDNANFLATYPLSSVNSASYIIGAPTATPQILITGSGILSGNGAVIQ